MAKKNLPSIVAPKVSNGLSQAIFGQTFTQGFGPGETQGKQISQVDTLFRNLRIYLVSNMRQPLAQAYTEIGVLRNACDVPVDDAFRGGVEFKSNQLEPEQLQTLHEEIDQCGDLEKHEWAHKWDRLFGGGGVIIMTGQNPKTPLDINKLKAGQPFSLRDVDLWELCYSKQSVSAYASTIDGPELDTMEYFNYYGEEVHKSRVMLLKGLRVPSFIRPRLRGWGVSITEMFIRSINQYLKATDLTFEVLDEFKIDIYKIKNLTDTLMSDEATVALHKRLQVANMEKNYMNAITMDAEDDFAQKELSFQGIAETMLGIRMQVSSDLRMPMSKLFGISAQGFGSGEDDIENYNGMIEGTVRKRAKRHLIYNGQLRCQMLFGVVPTDLTCEFKPLRVMSTEQEENVKTLRYNRVESAVKNGLIPLIEYKEACNKENLLCIKVDTSIDQLPPIGGGEGEGVPESKGSKSSTAAKEAKS
jgi:phage-related protein (TIGR01555 family)